MKQYPKHIFIRHFCATEGLVGGGPQMNMTELFAEDTMDMSGPFHVLRKETPSASCAGCCYLRDRRHF
jgi:hypothetical protein